MISNLPLIFSYEKNLCAHFLFIHSRLPDAAQQVAGQRWRNVIDLSASVTNEAFVVND